MLANYCESKGQRKEAIEFLMMAGKHEEAFVIAQTTDEMDTYAQVIENEDNSRAKQEWMRIAQ